MEIGNLLNFDLVLMNQGCYFPLKGKSYLHTQIRIKDYSGRVDIPIAKYYFDFMYDDEGDIHAFNVYDRLTNRLHEQLGFSKNRISVRTFGYEYYPESEENKELLNQRFFYNDQGQLTEVKGKNWTNNFKVKRVFYNNSSISVIESGRKIVYELNESGQIVTKIDGPDSTKFEYSEKFGTLENSTHSYINDLGERQSLTTIISNQENGLISGIKIYLDSAFVAEYECGKANIISA